MSKKEPMPTFSANLSMMYKEHDFLDRFAAAARDGFRFVEYLFPYEFSPEQIAGSLKALKGDNRKTLVVLPEYNGNVYLSGRNLCDNKTVVLSDMNTYDLMNSNMLIFTESAAKLFTDDSVEA